MCFFSIYNKFKYKHWVNYSPGKRQKIIEKVEKKQAKKLHRPISPVIINIDPNWHCYGMFESVKGKRHLILSEKLLTDPTLRFHALETILHEGRHAYQYNLTSDKKLGFFDFKKKNWKRNYEGYITSLEDNLMYGMQPIERDAQKYAIKQMRKMYHRFKNERDYLKTMDSMEYRYEITEKKMREENGMFFKHKINKAIKNKRNTRFR